MRVRDLLFVEIGCVPAALVIVLLCGAMGGERGVWIGLCLVGGVLVFVGLLVPIVDWCCTRTERLENKWYLDNPRYDPFGFAARYFKDDPKNQQWLNRKQKKGGLICLNMTAQQRRIYRYLRHCWRLGI